MNGSKHKRSWYLLLALVFVGMLAAGALVGGRLNSLFFESVQSKGLKGKNINVLLMGIDARNAKENSRSDTMILASLDPTTGQVVMVSIPRDTRIKNAKGQDDRINSINWLQGPDAACDEVGKLLNVPVEYYVVTNFGGFDDIVDALGGVHMDVPSNMYHADPVNPELVINIKKGYQHLDGKEALAFVRYRGGPTADIGRTENQQRFIRALAKEMLQTKTILRLPQLIPSLYQHVRTNIPLQDMVYLANMVQKLDMENIITQTLPGYFLQDRETGASYWEADKTIASTLIADLKQGAVIHVVQEAPPGAQPVKLVPRPTVEVGPAPDDSAVENKDGENGPGEQAIPVEGAEGNADEVIVDDNSGATTNPSPIDGEDQDDQTIDNAPRSDNGVGGADQPGDNATTDPVQEIRP